MPGLWSSVICVLEVFLVFSMAEITIQVSLLDKNNSPVLELEKKRISELFLYVFVSRTLWAAAIQQEHY